MSSIFDLSSVSNSLESENSTITTNSRKKSSPIHKHTREPKDGEPAYDKNGHLLYYCNYCTTTAKSSTAGLRLHLQKEHDIESPTGIRRAAKIAGEEAVVELYQAILAKGGGTTEIDTEVLEQVINQEVLKKAILDLVIVRRLPFSIVQWPEFHAFCSALNRESNTFIPTSPSTVSKWITDSFPEAQDIVRKVLQSAKTKIHLAVDVWTSPNRHLLLAICASFVDDQDHLKNTLIALRTIHDHSGKGQFDVLLPVLDDYGITQSVGALVGDNATTNDTLCHEISQHLSLEYKISWSATQQRIRCQGHILNLVVQAFLFSKEDDEDIMKSYDKEDEEGEELGEKEKKDRANNIRNRMGVMGKLHNIVVHSRESGGRMKELVRLIGRSIPLDNRTRWNSWFRMFEVALSDSVRPGLQKYMEMYHEQGSIDKKDLISTEGWIQLRTICSFLEVFDGATLFLQGDEVTLERVLESMDILEGFFEKTLDEMKQDKALKQIFTRVQSSFTKFKDYSAKLGGSPYYAAARILHPERRTTWLQDKNGEISTASQQTLWKVKQLWGKWRKEILPSVVAARSSDKERAGQSITQPDDRKLDSFQKLRRDYQDRQLRPQSQDELENFLAETPSYGISRPSIKWWTDEVQQQRWPRLSLFAIEILSIPAMSDKPERIFSGGRRRVGWERASTSPGMIEKTECMKDWKSQGILKVKF